MSNPISNDRQLTFDLEVPDTGKTSRQHRAGEVMTNMYELLNRYIISATEPAKDDRHVGQMWFNTTDDSLWLCDNNTEYTIQIA